MPMPKPDRRRKSRRPAPPRTPTAVASPEIDVALDAADPGETGILPRPAQPPAAPALEVPRYDLADRPPTVMVRERVALHLREGALWIGAHDVERKVGYVPPAVGRIARFVSPGGEFLAHGFFHPQSKVAGRVLSTDPARPIDADFFRGRLASALRLRVALRGQRPTAVWRMVNAEGDGLPGLIVDVYGDYLSLQINCAGFEAHRDLILRLLTELIHPRGIVERRDSGQRRLEGLAGGPAEIAMGEAPTTPLWVDEAGLQLPVDLLSGQKTGLYLDQRDNRRRVAEYVKAFGCRRVADLYCYTGGFGLSAKAAGAEQVLFVDRSAPALQSARLAWERNGFDPAQAEFAASSVDAFLAARPLPTAEPRDWDLAVIDPPKLTQGSIHAHKALQFHRKINAAALRRVRSGGLLVSCDCSGAVSLTDFQQALGAAAADAGVRLRLLEATGGALDHPAPPGFRMGLYLKALFFEVHRDGVRAD
ncbi:MAG: class I SAM-dependent rRNA methyltransferase [Planctomycetota bacterium]